jgi:hypothetical protein
MGRFYNAGTQIDERLSYTHPTKDPKEGNTLSYHLLKVEEKEFFEVPETFTLDTPEGEVTVSVNFTKRIKSLYQKRGIIQIDARAKTVDEDDNLALTDKDAKIKGERMWREYLKDIARAHFAAVGETKSFGGVPQVARGLTKYALNVLQMEDPADTVDTVIRAKEGKIENSETQKQIADLTALVNQLKGALETKRN